MTIKNILAGVAVSDFETAVAWYQQLIGRRPDDEPMPGFAEWEFEKGGWLQVFKDVERAGCASVTLVENNLEERLADLQQKKIVVVKQSAKDQVKTAIINDADGNQLVFAEAQSPDKGGGAGLL